MLKCNDSNIQQYYEEIQRANSIERDARLMLKRNLIGHKFEVELTSERVLLTGVIKGLIFGESRIELRFDQIHDGVNVGESSIPLNGFDFRRLKLVAD